MRANAWQAINNYEIRKTDFQVLNTPGNPDTLTGTELVKLIDGLLYQIYWFTECTAPTSTPHLCYLSGGVNNPAYHKTLDGNRAEFIALLRNYERVMREVFGFTVYNTCGSTIFPNISPDTSWVDYVTQVAPSGNPGTTDPAVLLERVVRLDAFDLGLILASDVHEQPQMLLCAGLLFRGDLEDIRKTAELIWSDIHFGADLRVNVPNPDLFEYHVRSINQDGSLIAVARCYIGPAGGNFNTPPYSTAIYRWANSTYYDTLVGSSKYSSCQLAVEGLSSTGYSIPLAFEQRFGVTSTTNYDYGEHKATTQTYGIDVLPRRLGLK